MNENEQLMTMLEKVIEQNQQTNDRLSKDNEFLRDVIREKEKTRRTPWIVCAVVSLFAFLTIGALLLFFSQYDFSYEEVTQDSADGGNNVYFPGENAQYNEAPAEGE